MSAITSGSFTSVDFEPRVPQSIRICFSSPPGLKVSRKQSPKPWRYMRTRNLGSVLGAVVTEGVRAAFLLRAVVTRTAGLDRVTRRAAAFDFSLVLRGTVGMDVLAHSPRCRSAKGSRSG